MAFLRVLPAYFSDYLWLDSVLPKRFRTNTMVRSHGPMGIYEYSTARANTTGEERGCLFDKPENETFSRYETAVLGLMSQGSYSSMFSQGNASRFLVHANGIGILLTRTESNDGTKEMNGDNLLSSYIRGEKQFLKPRCVWEFSDIQYWNASIALYLILHIDENDYEITYIILYNFTRLYSFI